MHHPDLRTAVFSAAAIAATLPQATYAGALPQADFDGSKLRPYVNAWRYDATMPDGTLRPQGIWTDQLMRTKKDGKDVFVRIQGTVYVNGKSSSVINLFDPKTLAPISDQQTTMDGGLQKRAFRANEVETHLTGKGGGPDKVTVTPTPGALYDYYGGMYALLLATAPLKEGYQASFSSIDEFEDKPVPVDFKVVGREKAPAGAHGSIEAWKIASSRAGQYDLVAWVTDQPPYVIRLNIILPDKRFYDWTMI
jgi:hypothetical protein